jgi:cation diffusion facilitator CzcD-associated flavoprotein CzcO
MTYLVIGAGPSGLGTAKVFLKAGLAVEVVERQPDLGGQWLYGGEASGVYASTHLISSKGTTAFADFPMPEDWPAYPHHGLILDYLRDYARHFGLLPHIRFNCAVTRLAREGDGWRATFSDGTSGAYQGVVIANGHLTDPEMPAIPGRFDGEILHSKAYKNAAIFEGKRVLVVGMGNTGCDVAVDAVHRAAKVLWSVRGGNHFTPKFMAGKPADEANHKARFTLPRPIRSVLHEAVLRIVVGAPEKFGLPKPKHRLYDRTPIVNSLVLQHLGQGDIHVRKPIREFDGPRVVFADGTADDVDLVLLATGYRITFPFLDDDQRKRDLNWQGPAPHLHLNVFPPEENNLFVVGLLEGAGIGWPGREAQADLAAAYLLARRDRPDQAAAFRAEIQRACAAPRRPDQGPHGIFIDFLDYKKVLKRTAARLA